MKKILFITNRNILTTSGELRLIKNRAEELYKTYGISTDFVAFQKPSRILSDNKETIDAGGTIETYPFYMSNPIRTFRNYRKIKKNVVEKLSSKDYQLVIISDFLLMSLAPLIKGIVGVPLVYDVHGAAEDVLEASRRGSFLKKIYGRLLYAVFLSRYKRFSKYADGFFVVTDSLKDYLKNRFKIREETKFFIVPCATSVGPHTQEEYANYRKQYRDKYEIKDNEIVFVYSGGVSSWQCIEETIETYKKLSKSLSHPTKFLVFSHGKDVVKAIVGNDDSVIIDSYRPDELVKALCAGDYAFLLRKDCIVNNVAFPNKFLEYVQSGMKIITTPYVHEIASQTSKYNLGVIYDLGNDISTIINYINANSEASSFDPEKIALVLKNNSFNSTLKSFIEFV